MSKPRSTISPIDERIREEGGAIRYLDGGHVREVSFPNDPWPEVQRKLAEDDVLRAEALRRAEEYGTVALPLYCGHPRTYAVTSHAEHPGAMYAVQLSAIGGPGECHCAASITWCHHSAAAVKAWEEGRRT